MRTIKARFILGVAFLWASALVHADFSNPAGIWDIKSKVVVVSYFPDRKLKAAPKIPLYSFVQFRDDGGYTTIPWLKLPGQWKTFKSKKLYRVEFDLDAASSGKTRPPFLNAMLAEYNVLAQKRYGTAPKIDQVQIKTYSDRGKLIRKGMMIKGMNKAIALISFIDPATHQETTSRVKMILAYRGTRASAPSSCCSSDDPGRNQSDSDRFLAENSTIPGVRTTASGLQYRIVGPGTGRMPSASSTVTVDYREILPSGQYVDGNSGVSFALNKVIPGLAEGLQLMPEGAYYRLYLPPRWAYGADGQGQTIKPNSALIFDVVLSKTSP